MASKPSARFLQRISLAALAVVAACTLSSCKTLETASSGPKNSFSYDPVTVAPTRPGNVRLALSTGAQRLYVVEGDKVLLATPVCVGTAATPTPLGNYTIYSKTANRRRFSQPGAGYPMTYWMEFKPAYGIHWGFLKPYPATHGCVRTPLKAMRKVFAMTPTGTPINIARSQPWDSTIGAQLPVLDDSALPDPPMSYMLSPQVFADAQQGKMWNF